MLVARFCPILRAAVPSMRFSGARSHNLTAKKLDRSFHIAIVGSGPSAFYAARTISKRDPSFQVDIIEKLPVPFGDRTPLISFHSKDSEMLFVTSRFFCRIGSIRCCS